MAHWTKDTDIGGNKSSFPETSASALLAAQSDDPLSRARGFATLVGTYWKPVYKCIRIRFNKNNEDAKDLTQDFFAYALEREMFGSFDPNKARFRVFMRQCLKNFVLNAETARTRIKRGGNTTTLSLDFDAAESELGVPVPSAAESYEEAFDREVAKNLESMAIEGVKKLLGAQNKDFYFEIFERYDLAPEPETRPTYATIAEEFGIKVTDVTNHLAYVRRKLREIVLQNLREITASEEEFREEARDMLGVQLESA